VNISCFDDLLAAARQQSAPQRLLFVFTAVELPEDCTPAQRKAFEAGAGGALTPLACVDKSADELDSFEALCAESRLYIPAWTLVFAAALSGKTGQPLSSEDAEAPLNKMVDMIKTGAVGPLIPFDTSGHAVVLTA